MRSRVEAVVLEPSASASAGLAGMLRSADGLVVTGVTSDAAAAVRLVARLAPSVVVVASDLPGAPQVTREIMAQCPTPIVVVMDPETSATAAPVLGEGAVSAQLRPRDSAGVRRFQQVVAALAEVSVVRRRHGVSPPAAPALHRAEVATAEPRARMVAIAASTGGPAALQELFGRLPIDLATPVVVVQHIVAGFMAGLAKSLQVGTALPIRLARDGDRLERGTVYLAPDDSHVAVTSTGRARVRPDPLVAGYRPSATVLFSSLAEAYGHAGIAVVLTGMGTDGLVGLHDVHTAGGHILAQDEASSVVYGMPGAAVQAGLPEMTASIPAIAARILSLTKEEDGT